MRWTRILGAGGLLLLCGTGKAAVLWSGEEALLQNVPLPAAQKSRWVQSKNLFRVRHGLFAPERNPTPLAPEERLFISVRGGELFRLGANPLSAAERIEIAEVGGYPTPLLPGTPWRGAARIRVPFSRDAHGFLYVRAAFGTLYEVHNAAPVPLLLRVETHELERDELFWEVAERKARQAVHSGETWLHFLRELEERHVSDDFVQRQRTRLPWLEITTEAERSLRLASFYLDVLWERQAETRTFNDFPLRPQTLPHSVETKEGPATELSPGDALTYRVKGPALLLFETRLLYPSVIREEAQRYVLTVRRGKFPPERFFYDTAPDSLGGLVVDSQGRPLGRRRKGALVLPPGEHVLAVESDRPLLIRLVLRRKRFHFFDALRDVENPGALLKKTLHRAEKGSVTGRYLVGAALSLLGDCDESRRIFDAMATSPLEPLLAAGVRRELARLEPNAEKALHLLAEADALLEPLATGFEMRRQVALERGRLLRSLGRHAEAATLFPPDALAQRAEARAWALDPQALDDYDSALETNPHDADLLTARQRFWFAQTYWKETWPVASPRESRPLLDPFSLSVGFNDATRSVVDARPLPGYAEIPPASPIAVEVLPEREAIQLLCVGVFRAPTLLRLRLDGEERTLPLLSARNRFTLPASSGVHELWWETPEEVSYRLFVDARPQTDAFLVTRWDERVYHRLEAGDSLRFPLSLDSRSWVRGLVRLEGVASLEVRLDQRLWTRVGLESPAGGTPVEFFLPISGGFHVLEVASREKSVEVCFMVRTARKAPREAPPLPSFLPERPPWEEPDPSRSDRLATAYREGVEHLAVGERDRNEDLLLNAVAAFTRVLYEAAKEDPLHWKARVARGYALLLLSRADLAEREARHARNAPFPETRQHAERLLASALADVGDEGQALSFLLHLIETGFDGWRLRLELARLYAATGEKETARRLLQALVAADPTRLETRSELALEALLEGKRDEGFALMEPLESASEGSFRRRAFYVRAIRELGEGKWERALERLETLRAELAGQTPEEIALRDFYTWKMERIRQAMRLIAEWNTPHADRTRLLSDVAEFNEGWIHSPVFSWRASIPRPFPEQWRYLGEENLLRYPDRRRTEDVFTGQPAADLFSIEPNASLTLRVVGPTWLRLDVRPALPVSDPARPPARVRVEVALYERRTLRLRAWIEEGTPTATLRFRDVHDVLPGRVSRLRLRVPPGEHRYELTSLGGVAFVRPYALVPGPDAVFLVERGGKLLLTASPEGEWYGRLLAETSDFRAQVEGAWRLGLDDTSFEPTLRALSEQGDPWALLQRGRKEAERGHLAEALRLLEHSGTPQARREAAQLRHLYAQTEEDLRHAVAAYDAAPSDEEALEELGKLLLELGKRARDVGERTFWFNRALQTLEPLAQTHPERREAALGRLQARQYTRWERLTAVDESAAYQDLLGVESEPISLAARLEAALTYPLWEPGSFVPVAFSLDATVSVTLTRPTRLRLELFGQRPLAPEVPTNTYRLVVERNGLEFLGVSGTYETVLSADLGLFEPGATHLRFRLEGGDEDDLVALRLYSSRPLTHTATVVGEEWYLVSPERSLRYFVGTATTPLRVRVVGPTTLRLRFAEPVASLRVRVERAGGEPLLTEVSSEPPNNEALLFLREPGLQTVTLTPQERVAVRLYVRVAKPARRILTFDPAVVATVTPPRWTRFASPPSPLLELPPSQLPAETRWGAVEVGVAQGRNVEGAYSERFYPSYREGELQHRLRNASQRIYHRFTLAGREYRGRTPHYEVAEFLFVRLPQRMTLTTQVRGFWQNVRKNLEKAGEFSSTLRRYDTLAPSLTLITSMGYNYARSSLDKRLRVPTRFASQDIFSTYRRDHERNVVFEATGWYRPFFDVIGYIRVRTQTNRSLRPNDPDYVSGRGGVRFYVAGFETHLSYEVRRYFADSNRKRARVDRRFGFDLEGGFWLDESRRLHATFRYVHSKSADRDYLVFGLSTAFTGTRRLSDYTTAEEGFEAEKSYAGW